jgi:hypothetical protein
MVAADAIATQRGARPAAADGLEHVVVVQIGSMLKVVANSNISPILLMVDEFHLAMSLLKVVVF